MRRHFRICTCRNATFEVSSYVNEAQDLSIDVVVFQGVEITHICLNPVGRDTRQPRCRGLRIHNKRLCPSQIRLLIFMNHMNLESLINVEEVDVDVVERLVVLPQSLDEDGFAVEKLPGYITRHALEG